MKKILSIFLVVIGLISSSASSFATDVTPTAIGLGDTRETAVNFFPGQSYNLFTQSISDKDWFTWTNDTGVYKHEVVNIVGPQQNNLSLRVIIDYKNNRESEVYAPRNPIGNFQSVANLLVPPGATVYAVVESLVDTVTPYRIDLYAFDV